MCNVVPISAVQPSDPVIYTHIYIYTHTHSFFHIIPHHVLLQETGHSSLCKLCFKFLLELCPLQPCLGHFYRMIPSNYDQPTSHAGTVGIFVFLPLCSDSFILRSCSFLMSYTRLPLYAHHNPISLPRPKATVTI